MSATPLEAPVTFAQRALEVFGVVVAYSLVTALIYRVSLAIMEAYTFDTLSGPGHVNDGVFLGIVAAVGVFAGYVAGDLISGLVHWFFDRYCSPNTFFLGDHFVKPFRHHHVDPLGITRHDFLETNGNNCLVAVPVLSVLTFAPFDLENVGWMLFASTLTSASVATLATNQFHKWAHTKEPPPWVQWLQAKHLILPRDHHKIHHTFPYETHYCITTGWLNPFLVRSGFWRGMEKLFALFGAVAHRDAAPVEQDDYTSQRSATP